MPKQKFYTELYQELSAILDREQNLICRLATIAAALGETKRYLWAGFYLVEGNELVLGPFAGPLACMRIARGRGVCGKSWETGQSILVPNVHEFPDHIACSSLSNSEIVIPIKGPDGNVIGVLDVDHTEVSGLDQDDLASLNKIAQLAIS